MKWEKCTFGELKTDEVYAFSDPATDTATSIDFLCFVRGDKISHLPNTPVYRLIPDVVDAMWVENLAAEIDKEHERYFNDKWHWDNIGAPLASDPLPPDTIAIIRRHAPATPALDVSAIESKLEAIRRLPCSAEHDPTVAEYCNTIFDLATECLALTRGEKGKVE